MPVLVLLPRKQTETVDLARTLTRYVQSNYDPAVYAAHTGAINEFHHMRENVRTGMAQTLTPNVVDFAVQYNFQVISVESRFPISDRDVCCCCPPSTPHTHKRIRFVTRCFRRNS